jgi:HAD superfamily hydrolase (TIGR01490 family)
MAGSSGLYFGRAAYRSKMVSRRQMAAWAADNLRFRLRGSSDQATGKVLEQIKGLLAGVPEVEIARLAPAVLAGVLPRIYPQMLEEVHAHQDAGRATFIISAAGNGLVELLAEVLAMEGGIGTRYAVDSEGLLTGEVEGPFIYGEGKVQAMREFAAGHDVDLGESFAYSDSASDLPMLRAVGNPVAVNPDEELLRVAREEQWQVLRFEKLGRRMAVAVGTIAALAVGVGGRSLASRPIRSRGGRPGPSLRWGR